MYNRCIFVLNQEAIYDILPNKTVLYQYNGVLNSYTT